jgi:hypothetical protein
MTFQLKAQLQSQLFLFFRSFLHVVWIFTEAEAQHLSVLLVVVVDSFWTATHSSDRLAVGLFLLCEVEFVGVVKPTILQIAAYSGPTMGLLIL